MSNSNEITVFVDLLRTAGPLTAEAISKAQEKMDEWANEADQASGDGSEAMPFSVKKLQTFFALYCLEVDIWTANPADVRWAVPIVNLEKGWTVKSWTNALGAKHLFLVSPNKKVYASTWAWGPVRPKIDALEKALIENFSSSTSAD